MKNILSILLLIITPGLLYSQTEEAAEQNDSTYAAVCYWSTGDSQEYLVTTIQEKTSNGEIISKDSTSYRFQLLVLDSTATSYTIQWTCKDFSLNTESLSKHITFPSDMNIIYRTDELGIFEEIINWEEIQGFIFKSIKDLMENENEIDGKPKLGKDFYLQFMKTLSSKEAIETLIMIDVQQYHMFYGVEYTLNDPYIVELEVPNVIDDKPFTSQAYFSLDKIYPDGFFELSSTQSISEDELASSVVKYLKSLGQEIDLKEVIKLRLKNETKTVSILNDMGTVEYSFMEKTISNGQTTNIKQCEIIPYFE